MVIFTKSQAHQACAQATESGLCPVSLRGVRFLQETRNGALCEPMWPCHAAWPLEFVHSGPSGKQSRRPARVVTAVLQSGVLGALCLGPRALASTGQAPLTVPRGLRLGPLLAAPLLLLA